MEVDWMPLEKLLKKETTGFSMTIGLPAEHNQHENRVALTPEDVNTLVEMGFTVLTERGLGAGTRFTDHQFAEAGATMTSSHSEAFFADMVIRLSPPDLGEIELMKPQSALLTTIAGVAKNEKYLQTLLNNKITAIAIEYIQTPSGEVSRNTDACSLETMLQEIAGFSAVMTAATLFSDNVDGQGRTLCGFAGTPPAEVLILGSNAIAVTAADTALKLGAQVKVLGQSLSELFTLMKTVKTPPVTGILGWKSLSESLYSADIVIATFQFIDTPPPILIPAEMVARMKQNAVIMDLSINCGGCFETSQPTTLKHPTYQECDVIHYCVPNITAATPQTTSSVISRFIAEALQKVRDEGGLENFLRLNPAWLNGVYSYKGYITSLNISRIHNLPFKEINLLMAIFNK
jgi:alanine dehydrogenase